MRDLPIVARSVINIVLFILYWAILCLLIGVIASFVSGGVSNAMADKIALFAAAIVLLVSLVFRRHFYLLGREEEVVVVKESYTAKKKQPNKKSKKTMSIEDDDEIKIYVDKEIK